MADVIYKFLSVENAFKVMEENQLKVSLLSELNDIFDCRLNTVPFTADPSRPESSWAAKILESISERTGLLCFSKNYRSPLLWGHYADGAKGLALGFDPGFFKKLQEPIHVAYQKQRSELSWPKDITQPFLQELTRDLFGTKAEEWNYESEVRYLVKLEDCVPRTRMYFTKFNGRALREVIVGPRSPARPAYLRNFLATHYKGIGVSLHTADLHPERFEVAVRPFPPDEPFVS